MAFKDIDWGASDSSDDDTVSLTSTKVEENNGQPFELDGVLAERFINGEKEYLVKWKDYEDDQNTWQKKESFHHEQTLLDWTDQKMQISRGRAEPFDVDAWEAKVDRILTATRKRKARRREKKIELGIPVPSLPPETPDPSSASASAFACDTSSNKYPSTGSDGLVDSDPQTKAASPVWTVKEETTLLKALQRLKKPDWEMIRTWHGSAGLVSQNLQQRSANALQRKALALKRDFDASGKEFPVLGLLDTASDNALVKGKDVGNASPTNPTRKHMRDRLSLDNPMSELVESLKGMKKPVSGNVGEPQIGPRSDSPRKRKSDHQVFGKVKRPENLKIQVPTSVSKTAGPRSAQAAPSSMASTKSPALPNSASARLPNRPATTSSNAGPRPTQLGTVGRGPARAGITVPETASKPQINVLGNWGEQPKKRRKSRYEMKDPTDPSVKTSGKFKKFSTLRKFELATRYERTPDVSSLTFVNLKDGKTPVKPPASVASEPPKKTPFELLQERRHDNQEEAPSIPDDAPRPRLERISTAETYIENPRVAGSGNQHPDDQTVNALAESTAPMRRASLPLEAYTQRETPSPQTFAAPVAMMSSGQNQSKHATSSDRLILTQVSTSTSLRRDERDDTPGNSGRVLLRRASVPEGIGKPKVSIDPNKKTPDLINDKRRSSQTGDSRKQDPSVPLSRRPSQTQIETHPTLGSKDGLEPVAQPHSIPPFQPRDDGYALYPLPPAGRTVNMDFETHLTSTDVIAEIVTGPQCESTGTVIFRGLGDFDLKRLFITIRVLPRQMHVKCETMCTAGEYATFFHSIEGVDTICTLLSEYASGGLFFAEGFSLLIYPAYCVAWHFLDQGFPSVPPDAKLRFAMFASWPRLCKSIEEKRPGFDNLEHSAGLQGLPIDRVFQSHFSMDFQRLVTQSSDLDGRKSRSTKTFFLVFPSDAKQEFDTLVDWIGANNKEATIYRHTDRGAWDYFYRSVDNGVIICHTSFYDYYAMPYLEHALRKSINMFNFSLEPMSPFGPDPHLIRLFPTGQAILLTDSLFLLHPTQAAQILSWFRLMALKEKPPGTWKICTRPAVREWLLTLQEHFKYPHGKDFVACYGEIMRLLPREKTKEVDREVPKEDAPIACMGEGVSNFDQSLGTSTELDGQGIMKNDLTLMNWFAGWAMMKQEKYRRFHAVTGRVEESVEQKKLRESAKKHNHIGTMSFEKFAHTFKVWKWDRIQQENEKRREEAKKADEEFRGEATEKEQSPDLPDYEDEELQDAVPAEESLFLPMEGVTSQQEG
ncbi:MAG: hypothetical protein Q9166_004841 [cf. Caloplaca sp. 2 TL-2023]